LLVNQIYWRSRIFISFS